MNIKNLYFLFTLSFFSFFSLQAQVENNPSAEMEVVSSDGIVDISPAELQSLMEQLMIAKKKRQQRIAAYNAASYNYTSSAINASPNQEVDNNRIAEIEKLLLEISERLSTLSEKNQMGNTITTKEVPARTSAAVYKQDTLQAALQKELITIRKTIEALSLNPPPVQQIERIIEKDTIFQKNTPNPYVIYATEMVALRKAVDSLDAEMDNLVKRSDYVALEKQLLRIEQKIQSPIVQPQNNNTNTDSSPKSKTEDVASKKYMDTQFTEMRRLIGELKLTTTQSNPTPVVVTPSVTTSDNQRLAQQEAQIIALHREIAALKNTKTDVRDTIVMPSVDYNLSSVDAVLLAQQNAQFEELQRQIADLKTSISTSRETIVEVVPPSNTENEELKKQLAELRKMITQIEPGSNTVTEKVITEAAAPDTSYNWLKQIIDGKEKRQLLYGNNEGAINEGHKIKLLETIDLMNKYGELDVLLIGFTSKTGSPVYNQALSQTRAENAKKYLMQQGVHPSRIFTEYHGVDYQVTDPAQGRRVDLLVMIRR